MVPLTSSRIVFVSMLQNVAFSDVLNLQKKNEFKIIFQLKLLALINDTFFILSAKFGEA